MATLETHIEDAIKQAVQMRLNEVVAQEVEKAKKNIEARLREEIAAIALGIFKIYRVERGHGEIIIRVENKT